MPNTAQIDLKGNTADLDQKLNRARDSLGRFVKQGAQEVAGLTASLERTDRTVVNLSASFQRLATAAQSLSRTTKGTAENAAAAREWASALRDAERAMGGVAQAQARQRAAAGAGFGAGFSQSFSAPLGLGGISRSAGAAGAVGFVAGLAVDRGLSFAGDSIGAAREAQDAQRFLAAAARRAGVAYSGVVEDANAFAREIGLTERGAQRVSAQSLRLTTTAGRSQDSGLLVRRLTDALVTAGYDPEELPTAFTQLTTGQDELGDKLGLGNPSEWYERWAKSAGRTADSLSEVEKLQIRINTVVAEGEKVQGAAAERAASSIGRWDAFWSRVSDAAAQTGNRLVESRQEGEARIRKSLGIEDPPGSRDLPINYTYDPGQRADPVRGLGFTDPIRYLESNRQEIAEFDLTGNHPFDEGFPARLEAARKAAKAIRDQRAITDGLRGDVASSRERQAFFAEHGYDYPLQGIEEQYRARLEGIRQRFADPAGDFRVTPEAAKALTANEDLRAEQRAEALQRLQVESRREVERLGSSLAGAQGNPYAAIFQQAEEALRSFEQRFGPFSKEFAQAQKLITANRDEQIRRAARGQALDFGTTLLGLTSRTDALATVGENPYLRLYSDEALERDRFEESLRGVADPVRRAQLAREFEERRGRLTATSERRIGEQAALRIADITKDQYTIAGRPYDADRQLILSAFDSVPNEAALAAVYKQALADPAFRDRLTGGQKQALIAYGEQQITDLGQQRTDALGEIAKFIRDIQTKANVTAEDFANFIKNGVTVVVRDDSSSTSSTLSQGTAGGAGPFSP